MLGTQWIAKKLAEAVIAAVPMALDILVKYASAWVKARARGWREHIRCKVWWPRKIKSILTPDRIDDDDRADAIAELYKFETPPEDSKWALIGGVYMPQAGSGYLRTSKGEYVRITGV